MGEDGVIQAATVTGEQSAKNRSDNVLEGGMTVAAIALPFPGAGEAAAGVIVGATLVTVGTIILVDEIDRLHDQFKAHTKNKSKARWGNHTDTRAGGDPESGRYGQRRNDKRGDKNKKYIPDRNRNRRPK